MPLDEIDPKKLLDEVRDAMARQDAARLSKREVFASVALQGLLAGGHGSPNGNGAADLVASAYRYADAMLAPEPVEAAAELEAAADQPAS